MLLHRVLVVAAAAAAAVVVQSAEQRRRLWLGHIHNQSRPGGHQSWATLFLEDTSSAGRRTRPTSSHRRLPLTNPSLATPRFPEITSSKHRRTFGRRGRWRRPTTNQPVSSSDQEASWNGSPVSAEDKLQTKQIDR